MGLVLDSLDQKESTYVNAVRKQLAIADKERFENYQWKGKFRASAFESSDCCVKNILEHAKKSFRMKVKTLYKLELGKAYHDMYQKAARNTPNLKWVRPYNMPECLLRVEPGKDKSRFEQCWPEIAVVVIDPETGEVVISGVADDVEVCRSRPVPVELKSTNVPMWQFKNEFQKHVFKEKHLWQAKSYGCMMLRDRYYDPFDIDEVKLVYICTKGDTGETDIENEETYTLTDEDQTKFEDQAEEAIRQSRADNAGKDEPCGRKYCVEHGGRIFLGACPAIKE